VTSSAEMLLPKARDLIESTLGVKVMDIYACSEARDIAWQCGQGTAYHINADNVIVEIMKGDQPAAFGEVGEVVITDLNRYVMPIIRYRSGDLAHLDESPTSFSKK
jgi:phenylacetate-CoA ligase